MFVFRILTVVSNVIAMAALVILSPVLIALKFVETLRNQGVALLWEESLLKEIYKQFKS